MPETHVVPGAIVTTLGVGTNIIGKVYITDGTESVNVNASNQLEVSVENAVAVTGTFWQVTQPVSGTFWQVTQPVSATDLDIRNLTAATDVVKIGDGTETANVTASNELNVLDSNSANILTAVQLIDDIVHVEDTQHATGHSGAFMLSVRNDTASALCDADGDYTALITDSTGRLHVTLADTIAVTGTFYQVTQPVSGTFWQVTQPVSATNLDIRNLAPATDSVKINDGSTDLAIAVEDSAAKTAGLQAMGRYDSTIPTAVSDGDATLLLTDAYGVQQTTGHVSNAFWKTDNQSSAQTNTELIATPGGGLSLYLTDIIMSNGATAGNIKLVEDTGGTPVDIEEVKYFAINGGYVANLRTPKKLTANKNLGYTSVACTTHSVTVSGYIAP